MTYHNITEAKNVQVKHFPFVVYRKPSISKQTALATILA